MKNEVLIVLTHLVSIYVVLQLPCVYSDVVSNGDINWWCSQTPYPEVCKNHVIKNINDQPPGPSNNISRAQFLTMATETTLEEVKSALQFIKTLGPKVVNNAERFAWRSCLFFYDQTVYRLNKTLDKTTVPTADDIQTWLSAAATNIRTCNEGFLDVNMTNNIYPLVISTNVTQLISNCLAVNFVSTQEYDQAANSINISRIDHASPNELPNCVVAQDGSGDYKTIGEALEAASQHKDKRFVIYVKQGVYREIVNVQQSNIVLNGDGIDKTIITGNRKTKDGFTLYDCAIFKVSGDGFKAAGITIENTAGADAGQAVAMASTADRSVFYYCAFKGYQDTLLTQSNRQFYKNCEIYGTVDFIFGNAAAVFEDCTIYLRKPYGGLVVTAQGRDDQYQNTGIAIHKSNITAAPELKPSDPKYKAFLGRPWRKYSRTVYLRSSLGDVVDRAGWMEWTGAPRSIYSTLYYGEFENYGPGASTSGRVKWPGYHVIQDVRKARHFDVTNLINGQLWLPATGVPFDSNV